VISDYDFSGAANVCLAQGSGSVDFSDSLRFRRNSSAIMTIVGTISRATILNTSLPGKMCSWDIQDWI
jgi:hypothetical protein